MKNNLRQDLDEFHRVEPLEKTLIRLKQGLYKLDLDAEIKQFMSSLNCSIFAELTIPLLRAFSNGKGITKLMAEVSAYAEIEKQD
jgi:ribosomal protein S12 methylthiotransferase accessory factor YcaO